MKNVSVARFLCLVQVGTLFAGISVYARNTDSELTGWEVPTSQSSEKEHSKPSDSSIKHTSLPGKVIKHLKKRWYWYLTGAAITAFLYKNRHRFHGNGHPPGPPPGGKNGKQGLVKVVDFPADYLEAYVGHDEKQGVRPSMEDAIAVKKLTTSDGRAMKFFGVFDGHGGAEAAKFVAKRLPEVVAQVVDVKNFQASAASACAQVDEELKTRVDTRYSEPLRLFTQILADVKENDFWSKFGELQEQLRDMYPELISKLDDNRRNLKNNLMFLHDKDSLAGYFRNHFIYADGTTGAACIVADDMLHLLNVGDSRVVLSIDGTAQQRLHDHSKTNEEEIRRLARWRVENSQGDYESEEKAFKKYSRGRPVYDLNTGATLAVTRAFGDFSFKQGENQQVLVEPETHSEPQTDQHEFIIVACDGIWDVMSNQEAVDFVRAQLDAGKSPQEASAALVDWALRKKWTDHRGRSRVGSSDNCSAIVVDLRDKVSS